LRRRYLALRVARKSPSSEDIPKGRTLRDLLYFLAARLAVMLRLSSRQAAPGIVR
jgi:hypothetical protein